MSHKYLIEYYATVTKEQRTKQLDFFVYVDTVVFTINPDRFLEPEDRLEVLVMKR